MSERAALDSYIETLQILSREGDTDRPDAERERDATHRAKLIDGYAHELAEEQRHDHNLGGGCNLGVCHGDSLPDLIDPEVDYDGENVQLVRPGEEPTT